MEGQERTRRDGSAGSGALRQLDKGKQLLCLTSRSHGGEAKLEDNTEEVNEGFLTAKQSSE